MSTAGDTRVRARSLEASAADEQVAARTAAMQATLCAAVLSLGRVVTTWSLMVALTALGLLALVPAGWVAGGGVPWGIASLGFGISAAWYDLRVRLDEQVFRTWEQRWRGMEARPEWDMQAFDQACATALRRQRVSPAAASRSLDERCRAARRLLLRQILFAVLQTIALTGQLVLVGWSG